MAKLLLSIIALFSIAASSSAAPAEKYAEATRNARWTWMLERASFVHSLSTASSVYDLAVIRPHDEPLHYWFRILDGKREVYAWKGHANSVFVVKDDRLFYVDFAVGAPGGTVIAVDLKAGKELWRSRLRAIEKLGGRFSYHNLVNISYDGELLHVDGKESGGRYVELKDAKTGDTVGHKLVEGPSEGQAALW